VQRKRLGLGRLLWEAIFAKMQQNNDLELQGQRKRLGHCGPMAGELEGVGVAPLHMAGFFEFWKQVGKQQFLDDKMPIWSCFGAAVGETPSGRSILPKCSKTAI
jgi:hypothetical protein